MTLEERKQKFTISSNTGRAGYILSENGIMATTDGEVVVIERRGSRMPERVRVSSLEEGKKLVRRAVNPGKVEGR